MDQSKTIKDCPQPPYVNSVPSNAVHHKAHPVQRQGVEAKVQEKTVIDKKLQKAIQEKWRRDRLSRQLVELEFVLDRGRYKTDKETLIDDTIQTHLSLTTEVNLLKAEAAMLSQQKKQLAQEKNELKKDTASLKSEIGNLKKLNQYQQHRFRFMSPWPPIDPTVVIAPMPYSFPVIHPCMQPFHWFGFRNPGLVPNASSAFVPYPACSNPSVNQPHTSRIPNNGSESSCSQSGCDSNDLDTTLELKKPGSASLQELSRGDRKGKRPLIVEKSRKNKSDFSNRNSSRG